MVRCRSRLGLLSFLMVIALNPAYGAGFDPERLKTIFGFEVDFHKKASFGPVIQEFGPAPKVETGDAGDYEGSLGYLDRHGAYAVRFTTSECSDGWIAGSKGDVLLERFSGCSRDFSQAGAGILHLGAKEQSVLAAFQAPLKGDWRLASRLSINGKETWNFEKTIQTEQGPYCDHVYVSMATRNGRIVFIKVFMDGCDDSACRITKSN